MSTGSGSTTPPAMMPSNIGRYRVDAFLGQRGRLHVYQVFNPRLNRDLSITILAPHYAVGYELKRNFRQEVTQLARLNHPAIVPVYDFGEWHNHPYMVLPFMAGGTLTEQQS